MGILTNKQTNKQHLKTPCCAVIWFIFVSWGQIHRFDPTFVPAGVECSFCTSRWIKGSTERIIVTSQSHKSKLQRPTWGLCCHMCCGFLITYHCNWPTSRFFRSGVKGTFCSRFSTEYNKYRSSGHYCSQQSCPDPTLQLLRAQAHVNDFFVVRYSNSAEPHEEPSFFLLQASGHKWS